MTNARAKRRDRSAMSHRKVKDAPSALRSGGHSAAVAAGLGRYAHLAPGRSMVEELIAERRAEAAADDQAPLS